jgi:hypothetical protein
MMMIESLLARLFARLTDRAKAWITSPARRKMAVNPKSIESCSCQENSLIVCKKVELRLGLVRGHKFEKRESYIWNPKNSYVAAVPKKNHPNIFLNKNLP